VPFTPAHPAAAVPLRRLLGRRGVLSALVIGSIAPDLAYFLPLGVLRGDTHSLAGLFWFCLPAGFAGYLLFHLVMKRPLAALLPRFVQARVAPLLARAPALPPVPWGAVVVSLFAGAVSHLAWDAFTHGGAPIVRALPWLQRTLASLGGYEVFVFRVLQHGSTALGLALLAFWSWRWLRAAPVEPLAERRLPPFVHGLVVGAILGATLTAALQAGIPALESGLGTRSLLRFAGRAVVSGISVLGLAIGIFSLAWHAAGRLATRRSA
jgi:hypothetical protein